MIGCVRIAVDVHMDIQFHVLIKIKMKMNDQMLDYWKECIGESLSEMGIYDLLSKDQISQLAQDIYWGYDSISLAFPKPSVKDFENSEVTELKRRLKELEKERNDIELAFKKNVSIRRGWNVNEIYVHLDGEAGLRR